MLRTFRADERGLTSSEHVLIAALFCAGTIVLLEALSHSLSDTLVYLGRHSQP